MHRIFLVSHFFLPFAGVGAIRHTYFASFFADKGWEVVVFKANNRFYSNITTGQDYLNNVKIVTVDVVGDSPSSSDWNVAYVSAIEREVELVGVPSVLLFSAAPYFYLEIGLKLKNEIGVNYIIDFRDTPFNSLRLYEKYNAFSLKRAIMKAQLHFVDPNKQPILNADGILTITESEKRILLKHYKKLKVENIQVIHNGYNEKFFPSKPLSTGSYLREKIEVLEVGVFGKLAYYDITAGSALLSALNSINETQPVKLNLIGEVEEYFTENKHSCNFPIEQTGFIDYKGGLEVIKKCHVCVLNHRSANSHGTKVFDYIGLNKPIIAFSFPKGEIAKLISKFDQAFLVQNTEECLSAFRKLMNIGTYVLQSGDLTDDYTRRKQAEKLLLYLNKSII